MASPLEGLKWDPSQRLSMFTRGAFGFAGAAATPLLIIEYLRLVPVFRDRSPAAFTSTLPSNTEAKAVDSCSGQFGNWRKA